MDKDIAGDEARNRMCKNSGAASCYLPCPWCGRQPYVFQDGTMWCGNDDCQSRTATRMSGEAWNTRGPREFTKNEIWKMFRAIETYIDIEPDASQKQFLQKLSNKIRLWVGSKR